MTIDIREWGQVLSLDIKQLQQILLMWRLVAYLLVLQYLSIRRWIRETDSKGNLISKTDANGNTIYYKYDSLNRLIKKSYPDGANEVF